MVDELTEGQRLYLEEEYERALDNLKEELKVAKLLHERSIGPEIGDPRSHQVLINSIKGEFSFEGQAGIIDFVRYRIKQGEASKSDLKYLSFLEKSSNEGIQSIALMLRGVLKGEQPDLQTSGIESYAKAAKHFDDVPTFYHNFGYFLRKTGVRNTSTTEYLKQAIKLFKRARDDGLDEAYCANALINQALAHLRLAEHGESPTENLEQTIALYEEARANGLEEDAPDYVTSLLNQGLAHLHLAEQEEKPVENAQQAIKLLEDARAEGLEKGTPDYVTSLLNQGQAHKHLAEQGENPLENLKQAIGFYEDARKTGLVENRPDSAVFLISQASAYKELADQGECHRENTKRIIELCEDVKTRGINEGTSEYAHFLMIQASAHEDLGVLGVSSRENYAKAIELYEDARAKGLDEGTSIYGLTLANQGTVQRKLGEYGRDPKENFEQAIELHEDARAEGLEEGSVEYAYSLLNQGNTLTALGKYGVAPRENIEQAIELHERARAEGFDEGINYAHSFLNQGIAHLHLAEHGVNPEENYDQAIKMYEAARAEGFEEGTTEYGCALFNHGTALLSLSIFGVSPRENIERAIELFEDARTGNLVEGTSLYASSLMSQANACQRLAKLRISPKENFEKALEFHERSRNEGFDEGTPDYADSLVNEAIIHLTLSNISVSPKENLKQAIDLLEDARTEGFDEGTPNYASTLVKQGNAHLDLGELSDNPKENFEQAIEFCKRARNNGLIEDTSTYANSLLNQGIAHEKLAEHGDNSRQNYNKSEMLYIEARQIFDAGIHHDGLRKIDTNLARLYYSRGDHHKAYQSYKCAIESIEETRSTVRFRDYREGFFERHVDTYYQTVLLALDLGETTEAFEYAERAKGRIFLEMLEDTQIEVDIPEELAEQKRELIEEISNLRRTLGFDNRGITDSLGSVSSGAESMGGAASTLSRSTPVALDDEPDSSHQIIARSPLESPPPGKIQQLREKDKERLIAKKQELDEVREAIREHDPVANTLKTVDVASLAEIQSTIAPNEQLLEYVLADDELVIFQLDDQNLDTEVISLDVDEEDASLEDTIEEFRNRVESPGQGGAEHVQDIGKVLYQTLIEPVEEYLKDDDLIIVPHGPLHLLPFQALYDGENYLVEQYQLQFLANASSLRFLEKNGEAGKGEALVVGDPRGNPDEDKPDLPHALEEAREVAEVLDTEPLIGEEATKAEIQRRIESSQLAHLCCHGQYDVDSPAYSSLLLAENELYLEEVFNLEVGANLVTLASCQTALGEVSRGDEIQSLVRAFQYAGATSVIGTLWRVDDKRTRSFFRRFYTVEGDRAEQLRQTQLAFIEADDDRSHPYYWSGFQLYGTG